MNQTDGQNPLKEWEDAVIEMFVAASDSFGFPRSMALIYGLLFCSDTPLSMKDIMKRLNISKGSASQGLKQLSLMGAVRKMPDVEVRRMLYVPERAIRNLGRIFLETKLKPSLQSVEERLRGIEALIPPGERDTHARASTDALLNWHGKAKKLVPMLAVILR
jgi:DNA-binding transcriptional regulator GbsR (MarR family)